jgi:hypothetical protein
LIEVSRIFKEEEMLASPEVIAEDGSSDRKHLRALSALLETTKGTIRVASAYVTDTDLLLGANHGEVRLLISLVRMDIVSGATKIESLKSLIESGVDCRCLSDGPRLHAKVYIVGERSAIVTSANLTINALNNNIEVGVRLTGSAVSELTVWFDALWEKAKPLDVAQISEWEQETAPLRDEYMDLKKKARGKPMLPNETLASDNLPGELRELLDNAKRFFVCNTNRQYPGEHRRTPSGGYALEEAMHRRGYAAAWEEFKYPTHMEKVESGDAIFMFAKNVGIIGIGCATSICEVLKPSHPDRVSRISNYDYQKTPEWRVPTNWLDWRQDRDAYTFKGLNRTFYDVTGDEYRDFREAVRRHFLDERPMSPSLLTQKKPKN